jgi:hypothetical protein
MSDTELAQALRGLLADTQHAEHVCADERCPVAAARAALAEHDATPHAARVYLVATGETHEGRETYTRHDDAPPPLCDAELLYTAPPAQPVAELRAQLEATNETLQNAFRVMRETEDVLREKEAQADARRWISVNERLPEAGVRVLVYVRDFPLLPIQTDEWNEQREAPVEWSSATISVGFGWDEHEFDEVSHWMPLPDPPADAAMQADAPHAAK